MPLYEYKCQACGNHSEVLQRFADAPLTTCKECGGALKKLISAPAVQFKGTGWYVTDYAGKNKGGDSGSDNKKSSPNASDKSSSDSGSSGGDKKSSDSKSSGSSPASSKKSA